MLRERGALQQAYTAAESELRSELDRRLGDALVYVAFKPDLTARQRRSAVSLIVGALSAIEPGFVGDWAPSSGDALDSLLRMISITRGDFAGPEFDIEAVGSIGEPTLDRIRAKSRKAYTTPHPIELVAVLMNCNLSHRRTLWLPGLQSFLRTEDVTWPFRHLWVFDVGSNAIAIRRHSKRDGQANSACTRRRVDEARCAPRLMRRRSAGNDSTG